MIAKQERVWVKYLIVGSVIVLLLVWLAGRTFGQNSSSIKQNVGGAPASLGQVLNDNPQPVLTDYKGVKIGASVDEVKELLDEKPKSDDGNSLLYVFSDGEMAQIVLDEDKKVRLIAVTYTGKEAHAPTYESVFGASVPVKEMADGRVYNMVSYPDAGYWVAYSSSAPGKDDRMIAVTMQKIVN